MRWWVRATARPVPQKCIRCKRYGCDGCDGVQWQGSRACFAGVHTHLASCSVLASHVHRHMESQPMAPSCCVPLLLVHWGINLLATEAVKT